MPLIEICNYIDGEILPIDFNQNTIPVYEPAKGVQYGFIQDTSEKEIGRAIDTAEKAFESWKNTPAEKRSEVLNKISHLILENLEELAKAESKDNGKPISLAKRMDIPRAAQNFSFFATAILHQSSQYHQTDNIAINYTVRSPLGVVACISPWNLPLYLFTWKIAPALAAGNTVVAKPSEITPYTAFLLSKICIEAGLPKGVLNIVHGSGNITGSALISHPKIKAVSFTGGTATGEKIAAVVAPKFKKLSLELGGKNPAIIFNDCNFDYTLEQTLRAAFTNQGQICLCGSRILIQEELYPKFRDALVAKVNQLKISTPDDPNADMSAVVSEPHLQKIDHYVKLAISEGGKILTGGKIIKMEATDYQNGWYYAPTVIEGLNQKCRVNREEIFGPVVTLQSFKTEEEAIELANDTDYGLAATVWTQNLSTANKMTQALHFGIVWVNTWLLRDLRTPFGGVKNSGVGREGGWEAINFFTEQKNVCIKL